MVLLDFVTREITIKLVYYGPALSGKTTNLERLHAQAAAQCHTPLMSLDTHHDRTLFFDLLPLHLRAAGISVRVKLFTVPGQVEHNATRREVLRGVDGVAFIADSRRAATAENQEAWANLRANLRDNGIDPADIPVVTQFNKRDLPDVSPDEEIDRMAASGEPVFRACALRGEGVMVTFFALAEATWNRLERRFHLGDKLGLSRDEFIRQLGALFGKLR
jgi:mutual gliding-motility protein MglA